MLRSISYSKLLALAVVLLASVNLSSAADALPSGPPGGWYSSPIEVTLPE